MIVHAVHSQECPIQDSDHIYGSRFQQMALISWSQNQYMTILQEMEVKCLQEGRCLNPYRGCAWSSGVMLSRHQNSLC